MTRMLLIASAVAMLAACGSSKTVYRGAPPPGYTDEEYRMKLTGKKPIKRGSEAMHAGPGNETGDPGI